jgi:hypothetical protein
MPGYLTPTPTVLDQTFPRSSDELIDVAHSLGEMWQNVVNGSFDLILTDSLKALMELIEWNQPDNGSILSEIYKFFAIMFLMPNERCLILAADTLPATGPLHPIPRSCENGQFVAEWAAEMGRLLALHDLEFGTIGYCVGVACVEAFCGRGDSYPDPAPARCFPLVGPNTLRTIQDAFDCIDAAPRNATIDVSCVLRNWRYLGALDLEKQRGTSHRKMRFGDGNFWILDMNYDIIQDEILKELIPRCNLPLSAIKFALINGARPRFRRKFPR